MPRASQVPSPHEAAAGHKLREAEGQDSMLIASSILASSQKASIWAEMGWEPEAYFSTVSNVSSQVASITASPTVIEHGHPCVSSCVDLGY